MLEQVDGRDQKSASSGRKTQHQDRNRECVEQFSLSPIEAANYVDQFHSHAVGFYFDCGNILAYGWPEQWIRILGKRIAKVHIKEYSRKIADTQGKSAGFKVNLREGDVNWPEVMKALDEIGYHDWATIEQPGGNTPEGLKDLCDRLKLIIQS